MKLNLDSLDAGASEQTLVLGKEDIDPSIARLSGDGSLELTVFNAKTEIAVEVQAQAPVLLQCSRCLSEFTATLEFGFSFLLRPGTPKSGDDEDENLFFYEPGTPEFDLGPLLAEEITVNLPMKPVCGEECRGFCPGCGTDLNRGTCGCKAPPPNPVWDKLRTLKKGDK